MGCDLDTRIQYTEFSMVIKKQKEVRRAKLLSSEGSNWDKGKIIPITSITEDGIMKVQQGEALIAIC